MAMKRKVKEKAVVLAMSFVLFMGGVFALSMDRGNGRTIVLVFVVLGGIGNIRGSVIAAVVLTLLPELLRSLNDYRMLIYAVILIATMIFTSSPGGQHIQERIKQFFERRKTKEA